MRQSPAFTIVELLIVIVVIGILAAIVIVSYRGITNQATESAITSDIRQLSKGLESYKAKTDRYATSLDDLVGAGVNIKVNPNITYYSSGVRYCIEYIDGTTIRSFTSTVKELVDTRCSEYGLVNWLPMNWTATDIIDGTNIVTATGATLSTGQSGTTNTAYEFRGTSDFITMTKNIPLNTSQFTISAWTKDAPGSSGDWGIVATRSADTTVGNSLWTLAINPDGTDNYRNFVDGEFATGTTNVAPSTTNWVNLVLTYDGNVQKSYANGVLANTYVTGPLTKSTASPVYIGRASSNSRSILGLVDDFRVYNRVLDDSEVQDLYSHGAF